MAAAAPGWGRRFEPHLRSVLKANGDRFVRCSAKLALASVVRAGLNGLERNRAVVVPGLINKLISQVNRIAPRAAMRRAARMR